MCDQNHPNILLDSANSNTPVVLVFDGMGNFTFENLDGSAFAGDTNDLVVYCCGDGGSGTDSHISDVQLNGSSLDFTGVGSGFNGSVIIPAAQIDYVDNVQLVGNVLTFTGIGNAFNSTVDLSTINTDTNDIDYISTVVYNAGTLTFTGIGNAFNSSVDISGVNTDTNDIDYISNVNVVGNQLVFTGIGNAFNGNVIIPSSTDYISTVVLNGNDLEFTGIGGAFTGSITLPTGTGTTDYVDNVQLAGQSLVFTGIGSAFNSNVNLSTLVDYIDDVSLVGTSLKFTSVGDAFSGDIELSSINTDTNDIDYISNVQIVGNQLQITGIGNAFNGNLNLPSGGTTYTASNGLREDPGNNFKLGGDLVDTSTEINGLLRTKDINFSEIRNWSIENSQNYFLANTSGDTISAFGVLNELSISAGGSRTLKLAVDSGGTFRVITPNVATISATVGQVLTLTNTNGTVEFQDAAAAGANNYISNVVWNSGPETLTFTGVGDAFNGTISIPSSDTHYANAPLTANGSYTHTWNTYSLTEEFTSGSKTINLDTGFFNVIVDANPGFNSTGYLSAGNTFATLGTTSGINGESGITANSGSSITMTSSNNPLSSRAGVTNTLAYMDCTDGTTTSSVVLNRLAVAHRGQVVREEITTINISANTNDLSDATLKTANVIEFALTGNYDLTGIDITANEIQLGVTYYFFVTGGNLTLKHEDVLSSADNRFSLANSTDKTINSGGGGILLYDENNNRFRLVALST